MNKKIKAAFMSVYKKRKAALKKDVNQDISKAIVKGQIPGVIMKTKKSMVEKQGHSPTPWKTDPWNNGAQWNIGTDKEDVAITLQVTKDDLKQSIRNANTAFIVLAVNCHEELSKYAKHYHEHLKQHGHNDKPTCCKLSKVIARADGL